VHAVYSCNIIRIVNTDNLQAAGTGAWRIEDVPSAQKFVHDNGSYIY